MDAQEEKFSLLDQFVGKLVSGEHYDAVAISKRRDMVLARYILCMWVCCVGVVCMLCMLWVWYVCGVLLVCCVLCLFCVHV